MAVKWIFHLQMQKDIKVHIYDPDASYVNSLAWSKLWTCSVDSSKKGFSSIVVAQESWSKWHCQTSDWQLFLCGNNGGKPRGRERRAVDLRTEIHRHSMSVIGVQTSFVRPARFALVWTGQWFLERNWTEFGANYHRANWQITGPFGWLRWWLYCDRFGVLYKNLVARLVPAIY